MRAVVDTNVLISASFSLTTVPGRILTALLSAQFEPVTSAAILEELGGVLRRPRIVARHGWAEEDIAAYVAEIRKASLVVEPRESFSVVRDPGDNLLIEAAVEGQVEYLVSGDNDLQVLKAFRDVRITSPAEFLIILETEGI